MCTLALVGECVFVRAAGVEQGSGATASLASERFDF